MNNSSAITGRGHFSCPRNKVLSILAPISSKRLVVSDQSIVIFLVNIFFLIVPYTTCHCRNKMSMSVYSFKLEMMNQRGRTKQINKIVKIINK